MKDRHDRWAWNLSRDLGGEQAAGLINVPGVAGGVYSEKTLSLLDKAVQQVVNQLVEAGKIRPDEAERIRNAYSTKKMINNLGELDQSSGR